MPRPIIPGDKRALNKRIVEALANQCYWMKLRGEPQQRVWACRKAAWAIEDTEQDVGLIYRAMGRKGLESIENVGPRPAAVVADRIETFIDALDNPVYGFLSDRTRTRWGRRRPWLVIGTPLLVLAFIAFYSPPAFLAGDSLFAYAMLFYILAGTLDSVINANYGALFPELFRTDASRASTNALRQAFQLVAMIISIALTPMVTSAIGYPMTALQQF